MNEPLREPLSESDIKELCNVSFGGDLTFMLKCYNHSLDRANRKSNQHQIKIFEREIEIIKEILERN